MAMFTNSVTVSRFHAILHIQALKKAREQNSMDIEEVLSLFNFLSKEDKS